jgi:dTDP-glucose 4,6-dehydratase
MIAACIAIPLAKLKILVTSGMGFIGPNFIRYMLSNHSDVKIVNFDSLSTREEELIEDVEDPL